MRPLPIVFLFISVLSTLAQSNSVIISLEGNNRVIRSNGIPDHSTGQFPNRGNPNAISAQHYEFSVPVNPQPATKPTPLALGPFGVALNGVVFDPGANEWWNNDRASGWQYEALSGKINLGMDENNAHVQPTGAYHYHGIPIGLINKLTKGQKKLTLLGWAGDGYPIYNALGHTNPNDPTTVEKPLRSSFQLKKGARPSQPKAPGGSFDGTFVQDYEYVAGSGDLDESNGTTGVTPEFPSGTYYYCITDTFPFIPRMFHGTPSASFQRHGPPQIQQQGGQGPQGGPGGHQHRGPNGHRHGPPPGGPGQRPPPPDMRPPQ